MPPTRFSLDVLDLILPIVRNALGPDIKVMSRIPDDLFDHVPIVVIRRTAGRSQYPHFTDRPWLNTQVWCDGGATDDPQREANNLCDAVRGAMFNAWYDATVIDGVGWIVDIRESSGPEEISDPDRPHLGRYQMTHEIRMRHDLR